MLPIGNSAVISMLVFYKVNDTNAKFEMALIFYPNYDQRSEPEKNKWVDLKPCSVVSYSRDFEFDSR